MKHLYLLLLVFCISVSSCTRTTPTLSSTTYQPIKESYKAKHDNVFIRKHPALNNSYYKKITKGTPIYVYGQYDPSWYIVTINEKQYFALISDLELFKSTTLNSEESKTYTPSYRSSGSSNHTIHTGPRGGQYYINKNGNKTYIKRK